MRAKSSAAGAPAIPKSLKSPLDLSVRLPNKKSVQGTKFALACSSLQQTGGDMGAYSRILFEGITAVLMLALWLAPIAAAAAIEVVRRMT
jgi:hypothetical protein